MWTALDFGGCNSAVTCPYCMGTRIERLQQKHPTWTRVFDPDGALFYVVPKNLLFCILHARLRIVDEFMEILTARLKIEPNGINRIKDVACSVSVPFQLYDED